MQKLIFLTVLANTASAVTTAAGGSSLMRRSDLNPGLQGAGEQVHRAISSTGQALPSQAASSSLLEVQDVNQIMEHAGVKRSDFDAHKFDTNGDGHLSPEELQAAAPFAKKLGVQEKLSGLLNQEAEKQVAYQNERAVFKQADADGSSLLEAGEMDALLAKTPIPHGAFDWRKYDFDGDGKLNEGEFLAAGPAAQQQAEETSASLLEQEQMAQADAQETELFHRADLDRSGFLEGPEMNRINMHAGIPSFNWQSFDEDKDGRMSLAEFKKSGAAAVDFMKEGKQKEIDEKADRESFHLADKDKSSFLEVGEMDELMSKAGLPKSYDWRSADLNGDGKLNEDEFIAGGAAVRQAIVEQLDNQEASLMELQQRQQMDPKEADAKAFHEADTDGSSFLEEGEMKEVIRKAGLPDSFNWRATDYDGDGKLNESEFVAGGDAARQASLAQFEQLHPKETKEIKDEVAAGFGPDDTAVWELEDRNKNGVLESSEMDQLMKDAGIESASWQEYDKNKDGQLSREEFVASSHKLKEAASPDFRQKIMSLTGEPSEDSMMQSGEVSPQKDSAPGSSGSGIPSELKDAVPGSSDFDKDGLASEVKDNDDSTAEDKDKDGLASDIKDNDASSAEDKDTEEAEKSQE